MSIDPAHFAVRRIARQLSIMGYVSSEQDFSRNWLWVDGWTEASSKLFHNETIAFLANSLQLQKQALEMQLTDPLDAGTAWVTRNRLRVVRGLERALESASLEVAWLS